jgi:hypothetical protein
MGREGVIETLTLPKKIIIYKKGSIVGYVLYEG